MDDKFILIGLGDENSKDIAEIMKSKTAKKIIDYLAERKEASEKEIADNLGMPLNTAEYNLNKLVKTGLVKKSDKIYWSERGKKIDMYQMARKHIIISSDSKPSLSYLKSILPFIGVFAVILAVIIGLSLNRNFIEKAGLEGNSEILGGNDNNAKGLKSFSSYDELKEFLKKSEDSGRNYRLYKGNVNAEQAVPSMAITKAESVNSAGTGGSTGAGARDYSKTNIQVEGVDEPDIVKNDGKYIYVVSGSYGNNKVVIVNAFPAEQMKIISEVDLNRTINQIFVNGDKLIIFSQGQEEIKIDDGGIPAVEDVELKKIASDSAIGIMPQRNYGREKTHIDVFDIKDRARPEREYNYSITGYYTDARMIGEYVYIISNENANYNYPIPMYEVNGIVREMPITDIYYFDYASSYSFTSISAIDLDNGEFNSKVYLLDNSGTIYVSRDNIYLTREKWIDYETETKKTIEDGIIPILSDEKKQEAEAIMNSDKDFYGKYNLINKIVQDYSKSLKGEDKSDFDKSLRDSIQRVQIEIEKERMKTEINKINVEGLKIRYEGEGEVPGRTLNQFSMDENNRYFRIATTSGEVWRGTSENNLYVLGDNLEIVGKIEGLARGEIIYSARFIGERAYLVTFKSIDPFFVVDLSDEENPKVLGYLKIPGFSNYLHPYDGDYIIGIGKDVNESIDADKVHSEGVVYYTAVRGVKISLFDVSNVENPVETAKFVIGDRGTDSLALQDHKAFLFDKEKSLLVLPITLYELDQSKFTGGVIPQYNYPELVWQGAYVLNIDKNDISLRGRITHGKDISKNGYYDWQSQIQRSLFMDETLYTISQAKVKANDLESVEEINEVDLPKIDDGPIYYAEGAREID